MTATLQPVEPLYLDKPAAASMLALSVSTFEDLLRTDPTFPRPRALSGRRSGYLVAELRAWGLARPQADFAPPPNTGARKGRERAAA